MKTSNILKVAPIEEDEAPIAIAAHSIQDIDSKYEDDEIYDLLLLLLLLFIQNKLPFYANIYDMKFTTIFASLSKRTSSIH